MHARKGKQSQRDLDSLTQVYMDTQKRHPTREAVWSRETPADPSVIEPDAPPHSPAHTPARQPRKSGLEIIRHRVEESGFTHPKDGRWLMFPALEFEAILALERKAVARVVLFVMQRTLGVPHPTEGRGEDGNLKRRQWVAFSHGELAGRHMGCATQLNV